jgi:hypothetical protein
MDSANPLSKLALDYWYQVLMVACFAIFVLTGTGVLNAYPTRPIAAISAGGFFIGLGEWINHPLQTTIMHSTPYRDGGIITGHPRSNSIVGLTFVVIGSALVFYGGYSFFV